MRLLCLGLLCFVLAQPMGRLLAADGKILKVLPHYLDGHGRHASSPSLFDRDAYQAFLRRHPEKRSALQLDVQWKAGAVPAGKLKLRAEIRGRHSATPTEIEAPVTARRRGNQWTALKLEGEPYRTLGEPVAWRVQLWDGDQIVAEQRSFLW